MSAPPSPSGIRPGQRIALLVAVAVVVALTVVALIDLVGRR